MTTERPFSESMPWTRARRVFRSPMMSPMLASGITMRTFMIGSSKTGAASFTASLKHSRAAISKATGFESTGCSLPS